jgi:hypothetical protein
MAYDKNVIEDSATSLAASCWTDEKAAKVFCE